MRELKQFLQDRRILLSIFFLASVLACALACMGQEFYALSDGTTVEYIRCFENDPSRVLRYSEQFPEENWYVEPASEDTYQRTEEGAVVLSVREKFPIQLKVDGKITEVLSGVGTVQSILREHQVELGEQDLVKPGLHQAITQSGSIQVTRVTSAVEEETVVLRFQTEEQDNEDLPYGEQKIVQKGKDGKRWQKVRITYYDGKEQTREILEQKVLKQPVTQIVDVGTARMIDGYRYTEEYIMEATAYPSGDITALGFIGYEGVVAVDPDVIPLGSRVYIPGYGEGYAADTGAAIEGYRIDLCMASHQRIDEFGRQDVTVYLLE